ncbi:ABC transporter ATP-binding protein [Rhizobium leguminosarum]
MASDLFGFIWLMGRRHQALIAGLSMVLFAIGAAPLELQRRIINEATQQASYGSLLFLVSLYLAVAVVEGAIKFTLNLYRSWVGERGTLWLRARVLHQAETPPSESMLEGVELSIVLAEAEPVGGFVGTSISEPLLQVGILVTVCSYLIYLQPLMMLAVAATFAPQIAFVPMMQAAINRRVEAKVAIMRDVSVGMVHAIEGGQGENPQTSRIGAIFSANMGIYRYKYAMNFLMNLMAQLGYVGIFVLGESTLSPARPRWVPWSHLSRVWRRSSTLGGRSWTGIVTSLLPRRKCSGSIDIRDGEHEIHHVTTRRVAAHSAHHAGSPHHRTCRHLR